MISLLLLCIAATAGVAFAVSALAGAALARVSFDRLTPAAQARLLLVVALLPAAASIAAMTAALAPSFGWIADHCLRAAEPHTHPHICAHHVASLPALPAVLLAALLLARLAHAALRLAWLGMRARAARRGLARIAQPASDASLGTPPALQVLPFDEPQAFVIGLWRPALFVTRGLLSDAYREHLEPVLAHEHAHLRRRDPLRRLVSSIALAFHLPGVAGWFERRLGRAHELAADAEAAAEVRSPERVARALLRLARKQRARAVALAFHISAASDAADIGARVACLLDPGPRRDQPGPALIAITAAIALALLAASAEPVHHGIEMFLGLLGA
ncbi:MAG TPA: M56 family metallopeptidase [Haliangium sp.]|nr:M56 family metallopeptidase [Haliangium sp.]